jgi:hypothetical protein
MKRLLFLLCFLTCESALCQVHVKIQHVVNGQPLTLNKQLYTNAAGDTFNITLFKYYLSNFVLTDQSGPHKIDGCFLVSEDSTASKSLSFNLPEGHYDSISFVIGVDSLLNCTGAQDGALDPIYGMFWTWNSGYIMAKLEGTSPSSRQPNHLIEFHIGGYRAPHQTQRKVTLALKGNDIVLQADIATWFTNISFKQTSGFMAPGATADHIADNYQHMFSVKASAP